MSELATDNLCKYMRLAPFRVSVGSLGRNFGSSFELWCSKVASGGLKGVAGASEEAPGAPKGAILEHLGLLLGAKMDIGIVDQDPCVRTRRVGM